MNPDALTLVERLSATPEAPWHLPPELIPLWHNCAARLVKLRIIAKSDKVALELFCTHYHRYKNTEDDAERLEYWRLCRTWLHRFMLIAERDIFMCHYDPVREDPDLAHWFAPLSDDERGSAAHE